MSQNKSASPPTPRTTTNLTKYPGTGCQPLSTTTARPSTLITRDRTVVSFTCSNECEALSHSRDIVCNYGNWTEDPPHCSDAGRFCAVEIEYWNCVLLSFSKETAISWKQCCYDNGKLWLSSLYSAGYTCAELPGPGNGTLLFKKQIVYSVAGAKCGESVEVTSAWYISGCLSSYHERRLKIFEGIKGLIHDEIFLFQVHCNTYFELDGKTKAHCTPYGWSNKNNACLRK